VCSGLWDAAEEVQYEESRTAGRRGGYGFGVLLSLKYTSQHLVGRLASFFLTASLRAVLALQEVFFLFSRGLIHPVWLLASRQTGFALDHRLALKCRLSIAGSNTFQSKTRTQLARAHKD
jgi:hypothetical protein